MRRFKRRWMFIISMIGFCFITSSMFSSGFAFARDVTEVEKLIVDKAVYQGVYKCYTGGFVLSQIDSLNEYAGNLDFLFGKKDSGENYVPLVTGIGSSKVFQASRYKVKDSGLSCKQIIAGGNYVFGGSNQNVLTASGKTMPERGDTKGVVSLVENLGYKTKGGSGTCYGLKYSYDSGSASVEGNTNSVCVDGDNLTVQAGTGNTSGAATRYAIFSVNGLEICLDVKNKSGTTGRGSNTTVKHYCANLNNKSDLNGQWLMNEIVSKKCEYDNDSKKYLCNGYSISNSTSSTYSQDSLEGYSANFDGSASNAALIAIRFLSDDSKYSNNESLGLDRVEKRMLYQDYLESYYGVSVDCSEGAVGDEINWLDKSVDPPAIKKCVIANGATNSAKNKDKKVNGVNDRGYFEYESLGLDDLISEIKKMPTNYTEDELSEVEALVDSGIEGAAQGEDDICFSNAGALGWILCPLITGVSGVGEHMWTQIENNHLRIRASELFKSDGGVAQAWNGVRDLANTAFAVLFLVVIISQITGFGIDNYGIKKIMPKLIVVAILVNLSYLICEVAVDLSNIVGAGLNSLFSDAAGNIEVQVEGANLGQGLVVGLLAGGGVALWALTIPMGIVGAAIAVVSVVVSVVSAMAFLYLILVVREAGIVLLVAASPIAIVCFLLPNTEKIYKKWFDLLKALLIVYPICGAMVGAGKLAGNVLGSIDSDSMKIAAMLVQVLPFFLIPMVLKNSLSLMGNVGAKISGAVGSARKGLTGAAGKAMEGSDTLKALDSKIGMHSFSKNRRASAFEAEMSRRSAIFRRDRNADKENIAKRLDAAAAEDQAKAINEDVGRRVAAMKRDGIETDKGRMIFGRDGIKKRLEELSREDTLTYDQEEEVAALMHAAAGVPGGAGAMGGVIRDNKTTTAFMRAAGKAYSRDGDVQNKLAGDAGAAMFTENFTPGGTAGYSENFDAFKKRMEAIPSNPKEGSLNYNDMIKKRTKSYEVGLNQSGSAFDEYLDTLTALDYQRIMDDDKLLGSIDPTDREKFIAAAGAHQVESKSTQKVELVDPKNGQQSTGPTP